MVRVVRVGLTRYELLTMVQKIMLTAALLTVSDGSVVRTLLALLLNFVFLIGVCVLRPFIDPIALALNILGMLQMFFTLTLVIFLKQGSDTLTAADTQQLQTMLSARAAAVAAAMARSTSLCS